MLSRKYVINSSAFLHLLELDKSLALDLRRSFSTFSVCLRSSWWVFRSTDINIIVLASPLACLHHGCCLLRAKQGISSRLIIIVIIITWSSFESLAWWSHCTLSPVHRFLQIKICNKHISWGNDCWLSVKNVHHKFVVIISTSCRSSSFVPYISSYCLWTYKKSSCMFPFLLIKLDKI